MYFVWFYFCFVWLVSFYFCFVFCLFYFCLVLCFLPNLHVSFRLLKLLCCCLEEHSFNLKAVTLVYPAMCLICMLCRWSASPKAAHLKSRTAGLIDSQHNILLVVRFFVKYDWQAVSAENDGMWVYDALPVDLELVNPLYPINDADWQLDELL